MSKKEMKIRQRRRTATQSRRLQENCPTPRKTAFATEGDAIRNMILHGYRAGRPGHPGQGIYLCRCGNWHRTSKPEQSLIREFWSY